MWGRLMKPEMDEKDSEIINSETSLVPKGMKYQGGQRTLL